MKVGPHPLPLSVPEFNRLALKLQDDAARAAALVLYGLLNAEERPPLAAELVLLRFARTTPAVRQTTRRFVVDGNLRATRCAASFVIGARPPGYRYDSNAVAFWVRADGGGSARRGLRLCSAAVGCVALDFVRDADRGWVVTDLTPLVKACGTLKK